MDVPELLEAASLLVPEGLATENDITVRDVWEYLVQDEWEVALGLLEELGDVQPLPLDFWESLTDAARQMRLDRSAAWCQWRCSEIRIGVIRADLNLRPAEETGRHSPIPGAGVLRPMWSIGHRASNGEPALNIAFLWVEFALEIPPGGRASVRIMPLDASQWRHLNSGDVITMHEGGPAVGTATILEVQPSSE
ncbi:hypothetical protein [Streptomyces paradoxus]|uniref:hypothetical protein n=1 Tax=Streptomyces paradoxus TaxID=66375 RepID=UPI003803A458